MSKLYNKWRKGLARAVSLVLAAAMLSQFVPAAAVGAPRAVVALEPTEIVQSIREADVFYFGTVQASLWEESGNRYLLKLHRGGSASGTALPPGRRAYG